MLSSRHVVFLSNGNNKSWRVTSKTEGDISSDKWETKKNCMLDKGRYSGMKEDKESKRGERLRLEKDGRKSVSFCSMKYVLRVCI
ncbi:hypothetical protein VTP01DRAFT_7960 [Rhizomucor pusillus]|uniref:uncharacterized protein n=1 Tax=Rhizomucor pusillus TaxID=4840 RepID=UPI00374270AC